MPGGSEGLLGEIGWEVDGEAGCWGSGGGGGGGKGEAVDGDRAGSGVSAFFRWLWIFS